jgi:hypothetical protein
LPGYQPGSGDQRVVQGQLHTTDQEEVYPQTSIQQPALSGQQRISPTQTQVTGVAHEGGQQPVAQVSQPGYQAEPIQRMNHAGDGQLNQIPSIPQQPAPQTEFTGGDKERVEVRAGYADLAERVPLVELREQHEFEPEVEGWLSKVEQGHEVTLSEPVMHEGEVLVAEPNAQGMQDKLVLPLTQNQVQQGLHVKVVSSARWLAEWCVRIIKIFGDQVQYKQSQPT